MARITGVTSSTPVNVLIDAGAVYVNYGEIVAPVERLLGATRGGSTFTVNQEFRSVEVDGIPGAIDAMTRIINVEVVLTARMLELSPENLLLAFPGATSVDFPVDPAVHTHKSIRRAANVAAADFIKNVAIVGTIQGKSQPIICIVYKALQTDNIELSTVDDDEAVLELNFRGHFTVSDLDNEPWEIRYPLPDA